jgi:hypothetical protein
MSSKAKLSIAALVLSGLVGATLVQTDANNLAETEGPTQAPCKQVGTMPKNMNTWDTKLCAFTCVKPVQPVGMNTWT